VAELAVVAGCRSHLERSFVRRRKIRFFGDAGRGKGGAAARSGAHPIVKGTPLP
jgi:hypothetical protein